VDFALDNDELGEEFHKYLHDKIKAD
jgi:hypothetical protein